MTKDLSISFSDEQPNRWTENENFTSSVFTDIFLKILIPARAIAKSTSLINIFKIFFTPFSPL